MSIRFGFSLPIFAWPGGRLFRTPNYAALDAQTTMGLGQHADALGFDDLWVADHLMLGKDNAILEGWTTPWTFIARTCVAFSPVSHL